MKRESQGSFPTGLAAAVLVVLAAVGLIVGELVVSSRNTLAANGNWIASKTEMAVPLMGAYSFLYSRQPLAGGRLDLAAWHGFQEVVLDRDLDPERIELDFLLQRNAYFTVEINRAGDRYHGLRISRHKAFPSIFFRASTDGRFFRDQRIRELPRSALREWHRLRIELDDDRTTLFVDDREIGSFELEITRPHRIGLRGGRFPGYVDNLRVVERDGSVFREGFGRPRNWARVYASSILLLPALAVVLFLVLGRVTSVSAKFLLFYFLMFAGVLAIAAGAIYGLTSYRSFLYPDPTPGRLAEEAHWRDSAAETIFARIEEDYSPTPEPGVHRVLFLGSSQTWGAGAAREADTLVRRTERLLNRRAESERFECINMAVSGFRLEQMAQAWAERGVALEPHTVIVNAANNDVGFNRAKFEAALASIVDGAHAAGARVLLVMEPNAVERDTRTLRQLHGLMAGVAESRAVPIVNMHQHLAERYDEGFLWWDWIHLTSYGQRLFAERLVEALVEYGLVELGTGED